MNNQELIGIKEIWQKSETELGILWSDDRECTYHVRDLRMNCPCAHCIDENTGKVTLDEKSISQDIRPKEIHSVGRYALNISFNDGHSTGIYSFERLRKMKS